MANTEEMAYWYKYMTTCTMLNAWDSTTQALNGADKDGDLIFLTDNKVLVENIRPTPSVFCAQRSGVKCVVTEEDLIKANIASFGDDIGRTTNWVTSMYDVKSVYPRDSEEYRMLEYRIISGQLYQQNAIDKAKGIVCEPMPRSWYDYHAASDSERPAFNISILADRKPYFMRYVYPDLKKQYNTYIKNTDLKCNIMFRLSVEDMSRMTVDQLTKEQIQFLYYYNNRMPVNTNPSVMNRICKKVEAAFDKQIKLRISKVEFDPSILKSDEEYSQTQYYSISSIYKQHNQCMQEFMKRSKSMREDDDELFTQRSNLVRQFIENCNTVCSNSKQLCNILIDLCYKSDKSKQFAWDVCCNDIMENILSNNDGCLHFPVRDPDGDIEYAGMKFSMSSVRSELYGDHLE